MQTATTTASRTEAGGAVAQGAHSTNAVETKQATSRQLISIVFILALATKMFLLPISLIQSIGRDAYIALAIGGGIDLITLGLLIATIKLSPDVDFFELLKRAFGKVGAKIFVAFVALFLFFKLNISTTESLTFYSDNVFADFDTSLMIIVLLIFLTAAACHTLRALSRLNELLTPIIILCLALLAAIVVMTGFDLANILPAMRAPKSFAADAARHAAWLGDFTPLLLFIGRTRTKKHTAAFTAASGVIGTATAVFFSIVMCAAFGNVSVLADTSTNLSSILQYSIGNVYGRIDLFSSVLWSISAFIETALFFYATCRCVAFVIGKNSHMPIAVGVCVALYFTQVYAMTDPTVFSLIVTSYAASAITLAFAVGIPTVALVCAVIAHKKDGNGKPASETADTADTAADASGSENTGDNENADGAPQRGGELTAATDAEG